MIEADVLSNKTFTLKSSDGTYSKTLDSSDDTIIGDEYISLRFTDIVPGKIYSLVRKDTEIDTEIVLWEDRPFDKVLRGT
jgi:hypothetical protein